MNWSAGRFSAATKNPLPLGMGSVKYLSVIELCERVLVPMNIGGVETKVAVPTKNMLTNTKYGFSKSTDACESRIVKPSDYYRINTNNKAGSYGKYRLVNETAGTMITVDLIHCNVFDK